MCGIHGFLWSDPEAMTTMIKIAHHRGPDGNGQWHNDNITLGHNLLSITDDASDSIQPWQHNNLVITYNGEIYNYRQLRKTLNYNFKTDTDTEVLAVGLEQRGLKFLEEIDGMFAFACYNKQDKTLILARDSNGAKPLYYGELNGKLAFSSEIKSLLALGFPRKVSMEGFRHLHYSGLTSGYITCFDQIKRLVPGEIVLINTNNNSKKTHNLNDLVIPKAIQPYKNLERDLASKLKESVNLTLMGRRNIGIFLSGGLDSSSVFYEAVVGNNKKPLAISTRFDLSSGGKNLNDDADLARRYAKELKTPHIDCNFNEQDWVNLIEKTIWVMEEPRQGRSFPAYYKTYQTLRQKDIIVTMSGDGGDELLVGYKHYIKPGFEQRLLGLRASVLDFNNPELQLSHEEQIAYLHSWLPKGGLTDDLLNNAMYVESLNVLSEDFLIRNDKLGMAFGMEARFPMLCNAFKNFVRGIPSSVKVNAEFHGPSWMTHSKGLLKRSYTNKLPDYILTKNKSGWRAPADDWIKPLAKNEPGLLADYIRAQLTPEIAEFFELPKNHNRIDFATLSSKTLFTALIFSIWVQQFDLTL